ncbi:MAG: hypothetical protein E6R09_08145 [Rhodocyclaceae bacterium]|nr:MAG: hypothetical protein E6R09_08145 [Rhodocyclaceae bacterium]
MHTSWWRPEGKARPRDATSAARPSPSRAMRGSPRRPGGFSPSRFPAPRARILSVRTTAFPSGRAEPSSP